MPSAQEYRDAAAGCRGAARRLQDDVDTLRRTPADEIATGPVADLLSAQLEQARAHLLAGVVQLAVVAVVCERRAEVCASHERALCRYWSLPPRERLTTPAPVAPAPWVGR